MFTWETNMGQLMRYTNMAPLVACGTPSSLSNRFGSLHPGDILTLTDSGRSWGETIIIIKLERIFWQSAAFGLHPTQPVALKRCCKRPPAACNGLQAASSVTALRSRKRRKC
jgi:hypothetical protein